MRRNRLFKKAKQEQSEGRPESKQEQQRGYKEIFLKYREFRTRQCVYISQDIHTAVAQFIYALALTGKKISVGAYIDNVLTDHLKNHKEEINDIYRQRSDNLL